MTEQATTIDELAFTRPVSNTHLPREFISGGRALFRQGGHPDLPTRCKLRRPENVITGDTRRVLTSVVKREMCIRDRDYTGHARSGGGINTGAEREERVRSHRGTFHFQTFIM